MAATPDGDADPSTECSYLSVQPEEADGVPDRDGDDLAQTVAMILQDADSHGGAVAESELSDARFRELVEDVRESEHRITRSRPPGPGDPRLDL